MDINKIIIKAGLKLTELTALVGLSRITVANYLSGKTVKPCQRVDKKMRRIGAILAYAVKDGLLPGSLPVMSRHTAVHRKQMIDAAIAETINSLRSKASKPE